MQDLDSRKTAGVQTPFDDRYVAMDCTGTEGAVSASQEAEIAEAALRQRARRLGLFLMLLSSGFVIAVLVAVWLMFFA
jgi:hypothetical protein